MRVVRTMGEKIFVEQIEDQEIVDHPCNISRQIPEHFNSSLYFGFLLVFWGFVRGLSLEIVILDIGVGCECDDDSKQGLALSILEVVEGVELF